MVGNGIHNMHYRHIHNMSNVHLPLLEAHRWHRNNDESMTGPANTQIQWGWLKFKTQIGFDGQCFASDKISQWNQEIKLSTLKFTVWSGVSTPPLLYPFYPQPLVPTLLTKASFLFHKFLYPTLLPSSQYTNKLKNNALRVFIDNCF